MIHFCMHGQNINPKANLRTTTNDFPTGGWVDAEKFSQSVLVGSTADGRTPVAVSGCVLFLTSLSHRSWPSYDPAAFRASAAEKKLINARDDFSFGWEIT
jgi:hypothetical protein